MIVHNPVNVQLMDVAAEIRRLKLLPVTSHSIYEPSSTRFHSQGLFSEEIFGQVGSPDRLSREGYIDLHTKVFAPHVFRNLLTLKSLYGDVMAGYTYARFDESLADLVACERDDTRGGIGYQFFMKHFPKLKFEQRSSVKRNDKIRMLEMYPDRLMIRQCLVCPAGIRDVKEENGRVSSEDVNKIYLAILSLSQAIPPELTDRDSANLVIYDTVRHQLQLKVLELYEYLKSILDGKGGFLQKKYTSRSIVHGTRNVITTAKLEALSPNDPAYLKHNESLVPLFQGAKMFQPLTIYQLRTLFYGQVFSPGTTRVVGLNKKFEPEYVDVTDQEVARALTPDELGNLINAFGNDRMRLRPVSFRNVDGKPYYLFLVYDEGSHIYLLRNVQDFTAFMTQQGKQVDPQKIRPLTYLEMMYLAVYRAVRGKHVLVTRYPVLEVGSIYPSKVQIGTTSPSRTVTFASQFDTGSQVILPRYPILGSKYQDSFIPHPSQMQGLSGDFDGDTVSGNGVFFDEANQEITDYLQHPSSVVTVNGALLSSAETNVTSLMVYNLTR